MWEKGWLGSFILTSVPLVCSHNRSWHQQKRFAIQIPGLLHKREKEPQLDARASSIFNVGEIDAFLARTRKQGCFIFICPETKGHDHGCYCGKGKKRLSFLFVLERKKHKSFEFIKMQEGSLGKEREKSATSYFRRAKPNPSYFWEHKLTLSPLLSCYGKEILEGKHEKNLKPSTKKMEEHGREREKMGLKIKYDLEKEQKSWLFRGYITYSFYIRMNIPPTMSA